jgi:hypothetical protein
MARKTSTYIDVDKRDFVLADEVSKASYKPEEPPNPKTGDFWVDSDNDVPTQAGRFIKSDSIDRAEYDPEEPTNPVPGDLWIDADAVSGNEHGRFIESNSIAKAEYDPRIPLNPVSGDLWLDPATDPEPSLAIPIDLTESEVEVFLTPGRTAVVRYNSALEVPLNVQSEEGIYEIILIGDGNQVVADTEGNIQFRPQNLLAPGEFSCNITTNLPTEDSFLLNPGLLVQCTILASTFTLSKSITFNSLSFGSTFGPSGINKAEGIGLWNNYLTFWTSLGTLVFPSPQTGRVVIRRIV